MNDMVSYFGLWAMPKIMVGAPSHDAALKKAKEYGAGMVRVLASNTSAGERQHLAEIMAILAMGMCKYSGNVSEVSRNIYDLAVRLYENINKEDF